MFKANVFLQKMLTLLIGSLPAFALAQFIQTPTPFGPESIAIIINEEEATSIELADYYAQRHAVPAKNMIRVSIHEKSKSLTPENFRQLKAEIEKQLDPEIQALIFMWTTPYQVGCNAITAAYTQGYQAELCSNTCAPSQPSRYFNSKTRHPKRDLDLRLSILLPSQPLNLGKEIIDRAIEAGHTRQKGSAYFLRTSDSTRNSRAVNFPPSGELAFPPLSLHNLNANSLQDKTDVMFYFTGTTHVTDLNTVKFLPGAIADHLTSFGGDLLGKKQMSLLRWLEAGATGSYGTVSEPCNHWQKFPHPSVLLKHYLSGETLIEAYWKSVLWPGQGLFVGDPLASPYLWANRAFQPTQD